MEDRVSVEVDRNSSAGYDNDSAYLKIDQQKIAKFEGVQSEKNMRSGGQSDEERGNPDYSNKSCPNATLPEGTYTATRTKGSKLHPDSHSITSNDVSLPGFLVKGIKAAWGFLVHAYSTSEKKLDTGWSLGCQVFPDDEFDRLNEDLDGLGVTVGKSYTLEIKDGQE